MTRCVRILKLEKTKEQIASFLGLSNSMLYTILGRAEFFKYFKFNKYYINIDFIESMYSVLENKKQRTIITKPKYEYAQYKLVQWKRCLLNTKRKPHQ